MKKYSRLQYFFWLISGSEISVLKECENDYNRYATSGALILATCLTASIIAGFAGYTYGNNSWTAAIVIAMIWGYLIFCIDRFMVISLKKNPTIPDDEQPFWKPLLIRLGFAFIIAFFMTIPLYHTFFYTQIETQISRDNVNELAAQKEKLNEAYSKNVFETQGKALDKTDSVLNAKLSEECPDPDYIDTMRLYTNAKDVEVPRLRQQLNDLQSKTDGIRSYYLRNPCDTAMKRPSDCYTLDDWKIINQRNTAKTAYEAKLAEQDALFASAGIIKNNYLAKIKGQIVENDSLKETNNKLLNSADNSINKLATAFDQTLQSRHTDFVAQFVALWRAAFSDFGTFFLVLMLEIAFIVIEIFPTYNKLKTKIGDYDWAIYYNEKSFQEKKHTDFEITKQVQQLRAAAETKIAQDTENERQTSQTTLNIQILREVTRIQTEVAGQMLLEWEKEVKNSIPQQVSNFIKSNQ